MNSLNRFRPAKQFRCLPLVGKNSPFGYVEILRGEDGRHNYQACAALVGACAALVGAFAEMNLKGRNEWRNLTGATVTTGESKSMSLAMSVRNARSFSREQGIRMNACSLLSVSVKNSQG